jgi:hypothetical protein
MQCECAISSSGARPGLQNSSNLCSTQQDFRKKNTEYNYVFPFCLQSLFEISLIIRRLDEI